MKNSGKLIVTGASRRVSDLVQFVQASDYPDEYHDIPDRIGNTIKCIVFFKYHGNETGHMVWKIDICCYGQFKGKKKPEKYNQKNDIQRPKTCVKKNFMTAENQT